MLWPDSLKVCPGSLKVWLGSLKVWLGSLKVWPGSLKVWPSSLKVWPSRPCVWPSSSYGASRMAPAGIAARARRSRARAAMTAAGPNVELQGAQIWPIRAQGAHVEPWGA